jgi:hypothetical protein
MLLIVMAGLSVPLWWNYAQPFILGLPNYIDGVIRNIKENLYILWRIISSLVSE